MIRRPVTAGWVTGLALVVLCGCGGVTVSSDDQPTDPPAAAARSTVAGVVTWDLRGDPSDRAFGVAEGADSATYESREKRTVRLLLPGDRSIRLDDVWLVDFVRDGVQARPRWSFTVKFGGSDLAATTGSLRRALSDLGVAPGVADDFEQQARRAEGSQKVTSPFRETTLGALEVGARATWQPDAEFGAVTVTGGWTPDLVAE